MTRAVLLIAGLMFLGTIIQISNEVRECRLGWSDISEYAVLAAVCNDEKARQALRAKGVR